MPACMPHKVNDDVERGKQIYVAQVIAAREIAPSDSKRYTYVLATLTVIETIKGDVVAESSREIEFRRPCGVDVVISSSYVVFEQQAGATGRCEGTTRLTRQNPREEEEYLQQVRKLALKPGGG